MDVGAASAISSYSYQTAVQNGTQSQAVLKALTQAYSSSVRTTPSNSADALASLASAANLRPLVSAIYAQAQAAQTSGSPAPVNGLQPAQQFGGLDSNSATSLLASLNSGANGMGGFDAAMGASSLLAMTAYQSHQTAAAAAAAAPVPPAKPDSANTAAYVQQVLHASQTTTNAAAFNLLS